MSVPTAMYCSALYMNTGKLGLVGQSLCRQIERGRENRAVSFVIEHEQRPFYPVDQHLRIGGHVEFFGLQHMQFVQRKSLENRILALPIEHAGGIDEDRLPSSVACFSFKFRAADRRRK